MSSEAEHDYAVQQARAKLQTPAPSTFDRMRDAAQAEASRIESGQVVRLKAGEIVEPMAEEIRKRDDFAAIVRLLDIVVNNPQIMHLLTKGAKK